MTSSTFTQSVIEQATLAWFETLGYRVIYGNDIAPEEPGAERDNYGEVILAQRLRDRACAD